MAKVAFLGLGVMGFPMAGHLAAKGHEVTVYNRTFAKAEAWTKKHKGKAARTPKEAAAGQEIVLDGAFHRFVEAVRLQLEAERAFEDHCGGAANRVSIKKSTFRHSLWTSAINRGFDNAIPCP